MFGSALIAVESLSPAELFANDGTYPATKLAATPLPEVKRNLRRVGFGGCDLRSSSDIRPPFVTSPLGIFIPRIIFRVDVFDAERPNRRHLYDVVTRLRPMEMVCIAG